MSNGKAVKRSSPPRIWWAATVLVGLLAVLFFVAHRYEQQHVLWPWILAFAEAGLVGGLADWFAVTALFRHPLGLPLAHTAILRKERKRISENIAEFVSKEVFNQKSLQVLLANKSPTEGMMKLVQRASEKKNGELWGEVKQSLPRKKMADQFSQDLGNFVADTVQASDVVSRVLEDFIQGDHWKKSIQPFLLTIRERLPVVFDSLDLDAPTSNAYGPSVFGRVRQVAVRLSGQAMIDKFSKQIAKAEHDHEHKIWDAIEEELIALAESLKADEGLRNKIQEKWLACLQKVDLKSQLEAISAPDQKKHLKSGLSNQLSILAEDQNFKDAMDRIALEKSGEALEAIQEDVKKSISSIIASWDVDDWIVKLEQAVGNDLQYIRINGTLIGGSVGVLLHWVKQMI